MSLDSLLLRSSNSAGAVVLIAVGTLAFLLTKERVVAKRFVGSVVAAALYLVVEAIRAVVTVESTRETLRFAGLVFFAFALVRFVAVLVSDVFLRVRRGSETPRIVRDMITAGLYAFAAAALLRATLDIDIASMLTTAGLLSIVLGLALQDTLGNFFSGLAIQLEQPFKHGDWVSWGSTIGQVEEVGWRATTVLTRANDVVIVPNNVLTKLELTNHSRPTKMHGRRQEIRLPFTTPPSLAQEVIVDAILKVPGVVLDPPPGIRILRFDEFAITYLFVYFVPDFAIAPDVEARVNAAVWYALRRAKISLPFPTRTVHMHENGHDEDKLPPSIFADAERLLADIDFLAPLDEPTRKSLARRVKALQFGKGEVIVREGDHGESFFLVQDGSVTVRHNAQEVATLARGAFFGEMSLLTGEPRKATVVATDDCLLLTLDREGFRDALLSNADVARQLSEILAARSSQLEKAIGQAESAKDSLHILDRLRHIFRIGQKARVAADADD